jgi:hypothetical protein
MNFPYLRPLYLANTTLILSLVACQTHDGLEGPFAVVKIGATRDELMSTMKQAPTSRSRIDLPLVDAEQITWKSSTGRHYVATLVVERVISKTISQ